LEKKNKFNYVIWNFSDKTEEISYFLKKRFKLEKLKATEKKLTGRINMQNGEERENLLSNLIDEEYFVFENFFGRIIEKYDYNEIEKRDMKKPIRREDLAIFLQDLLKLWLIYLKSKKEKFCRSFLRYRSDSSGGFA
jgi:hypothetical protein